jgi:N-acetylneuraminic acid mutarotase
VLAIELVASTSVPALAQTSGTWKKTGNMKDAREPGAILLQNGQVLVAGGDGSNGLLSSAELYNPANGQWTATGSMNTAGGGAMTVLHNGQELLTGADAELYDPSTGMWAVTADMSTARYAYTQTLLPNGKVLVAGGYEKSCGNPPCPRLSSAELYDPSTGTWSPTSSMNTARYAHTATLLSNGLVLVAGGYGETSVLASAELYNAATGQWTATGTMNTARAGHYAVLLASGQPLVLLGDGGVTSTELYNPATGTWTVNGNTRATAQFAFSVTLLNTGKVLIAGGANCFYPRLCVEVSTAELYDPSVGASAPTGSMNVARSSHSATLLPNGQVLAAGGMVQKSNRTFDFTSAAELYTP